MSIITTRSSHVNPWLTDPLRRQGVEQELQRQSAEPVAPTGLGEVIASNIRTNWLASAATWAAKQTMPFRDDPLFNAEDYILKSPALLNDPDIQAMYHAGQFSGSGSVDEFNFDYANGLRVMGNYEKIGRASRATQLIGGLAAGVADPINWLSPGAGVVAGRIAARAGLSGAAKLGVMAGGAFAADASMQVVENQLSPISDAPGLADNAFRSALAVSLGTLFGHLGTRTVDELKEASNGLLNVTTSIGPEKGGIRANQAGKSIYADLLPEIESHRQQSLKDATDLINGPAKDNARLFDMGGMDDLVSQLKAKYAKAGKHLIVEDHPQRIIAEAIADAKALDDFGDDALRATGEELDQGIAGRIIGGAIGGVASVTRNMTIGGRLAKSGGMMSELFLTFKESGGEITKGVSGVAGEARSPGAAGLKYAYEAEFSNLSTASKSAFGAARKSKEINPLTGVPFASHDEFVEAVESIRLERQDAAMGFNVKQTDKVGPSLSAAADEYKKFYNGYASRLDEAGMLPGPITLRSLKDKEAIANAPDKWDAFTKARENHEAAKVKLQEARDRAIEKIKGEQSRLREMFKVETSLPRQQAVERAKAASRSIREQANAIIKAREEALKPHREALASALDNYRAERIRANAEFAESTIEERRALRKLLDGPMVSEKGKQAAREWFERKASAQREVQRLIKSVAKTRVANERELLRLAKSGMTNQADNALLAQLRVAHKAIKKEAASTFRLATELQRAELRKNLGSLYDQVRVATRDQRYDAKLAAREVAKADPNKTLAPIRKLIEDNEKFIKEHGEYVPIRYSSGEIKKNPEGMIQAITDWWRQQRMLPDFNQALEPDVLEKLKLPEGFDGKTMADLPQDVRQAYRELLSNRDRSIVQSVIDKITHPEHGESGVAEAAGLSMLEHRTLQVPRSILGPYVARNAIENAANYSHAMSGRLATRRAIQLNPAWAGSGAEDSKSLVAFVRKHYQAKLDVMKRAEMKKAGILDFPDKHADFKFSKDVGRFQKLMDKRFNEIEAGLALVENRRPYGTNLYNAARRAKDINNYTYAVTMTGNLPRQLNDLHAIPTRSFLQQTGGFKKLARAIRESFNGNSRRDIERLSSAVSEHIRYAHQAEIEYGPSTGSMVSRFGDRLGQKAFSLGGLNWLNGVSTRASADAMYEAIQKGTRKMVKVQKYLDGGMGEDAALRKAGITRHEFATLKQYGIDPKRSKRWQELVYKHGVKHADDGVKFSDAYKTFDDYIDADLDDAVANTNFDNWDLSGLTEQSRKDRELYDVMHAAHASGTRKYLTVSPGPFDKPLFAIKRPDYGLVNTLMNYQFAFANNVVAPMSQAPIHQQLGFVMSVLALTAIGDAIANHLRKRRSFEETAEGWEKNPVGELYTTVGSTGFLGFIQRPLGILDWSVPWSPGRQLGASNIPNNAARYAAQGDVASTLGPAGYMAERGRRVLLNALSGNWNRQTGYEAWKMVPFQNWLPLQLFHNLTGAPVVPEAIKAR